jgi:plasmid stabilization system protein ParE
LRIDYSPEALSDLDRIQEYHSEKVGVDFAQSLVERIMGTFERIAGRNPRAGRIRDDLDLGVRALPVLPFLIFYIVDKKRVYVFRILHGHRNIKAPLASLLIAT